MLQYNSDPWKKFQYRLNDNFKENSNATQLEGITLKKDVWTIFPQKMVSLLKYIKTVENEEGIVDFECFHQVKGEIYDSSVNNYLKLKEGKVPFYKQAVLATMKRNQLEDVCMLFNIDSAKKIDKILVNLILEKQEVIRDILKKQK